MRLQGELALRGQNSDPVAAERCFRAAIDAAHAQQARSLQLRACLSLNRLQQQLGQTGPARRSLTEIYDWFTEGYDTADLQEAKACLDSPASCCRSL